MDVPPKLQPVCLLALPKEYMFELYTAIMGVPPKLVLDNATVEPG